MTPITVYNITRHELIGLRVKVVRSSCDSYVGLSGKIIDEAKNMLTVLSDGKVRKIPKDSSDLQIELPDGCVVEVQGRQLVGRPEERIRKAAGRRW